MSLSHRFCIAPMMQCTDVHDRFLFRLITKKAFLYTEMGTTNAIIHGKCLNQLKFNNKIITIKREDIKKILIKLLLIV